MEKSGGMTKLTNFTDEMTTPALNGIQERPWSSPVGCEPIEQSGEHSDSRKVIVDAIRWDEGLPE